MAKKNVGKLLESDIETSCQEQSIFYFRVRDVFIPPDLRNRIRTPTNKYDALIFRKPYLFPMELKSTKQKSISFSESIIKSHQITNLVEANKSEGVIAGFLMNFRNENNDTYFIPIDKFVEYKNIAENGLDHNYKSRVNKSSIPIGICEEIGVKLHSVKKKVKYRYFVNKLLDELIEKYE